MLGDGGMTIAYDPFFVELGAFQIIKLRSNFAEGFKRTRGLGKSDRNRFRGDFLRIKEINLAIFSHSEKSLLSLEYPFEFVPSRLVNWGI